MLRKLQIFGASAFVAFALFFAAAQLNAPIASAAQGGFNCCAGPQSCPSGMACTGPATSCPASNPPYKGTCEQVTTPPGPIFVPGPIGGDN